MKKIYVEVPKSLEVTKTQYERAVPATPAQDISAASITDMGTYNLMVFDIPEDIAHSDIPVENDYAAYFRIEVVATCEASVDFADAPRITSYVDYEDYYYYAAKQATIPTEFDISNGLKKQGTVTYSRKPSLNMVDQTGVVNLTGKIGEWVVRYENPALEAAPYNWLAIPNVDDFTVTKITRLSDGAEIAPTAYTGGKMYQLSDAGVASGQNEDYKIEFEYTGCNFKGYAVKNFG